MLEIKGIKNNQNIHSCLKEPLKKENLKSIVPVVGYKPDFNSMVLDKITNKSTTFKPGNCIWYSSGTEWLDWCRENVFNYPPKYIYSLQINKKKILKINTKEKLINFHNKYKYVQNLETSVYTVLYINWPKIANDGYDGIEIIPYQLKLHYSGQFLWYNGFDVACGCIWNTNCIKKINQIYPK